VPTIAFVVIAYYSAVVARKHAAGEI
jgi:hypothetical protein